MKIKDTFFIIVFCCLTVGFIETIINPFFLPGSILVVVSWIVMILENSWNK